jgi:uncharacterized protein YciI
VEYAIFLLKLRDDPYPWACIQAHVEKLCALDDEGRLIAAGPFKDGKGGLILARFRNLEEAEQFAADDPYVKSGYSKVQAVRGWQWSNRANGHLGVVEPEPESTKRR